MKTHLVYLSVLALLLTGGILDHLDLSQQLEQRDVSYPWECTDKEFFRQVDILRAQVLLGKIDALRNLSILLSVSDGNRAEYFYDPLHDCRQKMGDVAFFQACRKLRVELRTDIFGAMYGYDDTSEEEYRKAAKNLAVPLP